jgi:hypothetical protein
MRSGSSGAGSRHGERQTESLFVFTESVSRLATNLTFLGDGAASHARCW